MNYHNESDPFAAAWLRELIKAGLIPNGIVDERSIEDVRPRDLDGFTQCHFFAGIGGWPLALERGGVPASRPLWTGSCPCQPFSAAGKGGGFADERHLWPAFQWLIGQCRPDIVLGEQVEGPAGRQWLDLVFSDLEGSGYACGAVVFPAAGVGAPHIRHRTYWMARRDDVGRRVIDWDSYADELGHTKLHGSFAKREFGGTKDQGRMLQFEGPGAVSRLAIPDSRQCGGQSEGQGCGSDRQEARRIEGDGRAADGGGLGELADAGCERQFEHAQRDGKSLAGAESPFGDDAGGRGGLSRPGPTNGFWRDADWLYCRDNRWRPVEPLAQPLVDGISGSLGRVRADILAQAQEEILSHADASEAIAREAVFDVWLSLGEEALRRPPGRFSGVHEAPVLLAFLRQLANQRWPLAKSLPRTGTQIEEEILRGVRRDAEASRASCGRGLDEQRPSKHPDLVRLLPSILARYAQEAWGQAIRTNADNAFPLIVGAPARVGRLRGYGNAICVEQAAAFVESIGELLCAQS